MKSHIIERLAAIKRHIYWRMLSGDKRYCPVCDKSARKFLKGGLVDKREDARCSYCGSYERYRLAWSYLKNNTNLFDGVGKKMLHIAPEKCFGNRFKEEIGAGYLSADIYNPLAMEKMDIMDISYPDSYFDVIYCNHVLEHVENDIIALKELYRVLESDGWALLQVPVNTDITFEDSSITDPRERLSVFGQKDHVRNYGNDFVDRVRDVGFKVKVIHPKDLFTNWEIIRLGLNPNYAGELFLCTK